jgi:hypothetical protein
MGLTSSRIDFLNAVARANFEAGKVDSPVPKLWQVATGCSGKDCAVGLHRCWSNKSDGEKDFFNGFKPTFHEEQLGALSRTHGSYVVGVGWHGELADQNPLNIKHIFEALVQSKSNCTHIVYLLTKHPDTLVEILRSFAVYDDLRTAGFWFGTTVNLPSELERIGHLARIPGRHFVMFEPLMGETWDFMDRTNRDLERYFTEAHVEQVAIGGWSRIPEDYTVFHSDPSNPAMMECHINRKGVRVCKTIEHRKPWQVPEYRVSASAVRAITEIARKCGAKVFYKHNLPQSVDPRDAFNCNLNLRAVKEIAI